MTQFPPSVSKAEEALARVLNYARREDYSGYSKFDGLESPLMKLATLGTAFGRAFFQQAVKYSCPFNIRPFLGIRKERNPKGMALFARALMIYGAKRQSAEHIEEGRKLLDWLIANNSQHYRGTNHPYRGLCWGYNFHWQNVGFEAPRFMPNIIVTSFVGEAMMAGYYATNDEKYLQTARSIADFIMLDLPALVDEQDRYCVGYVPTEKPFLVINVNSVSGALLAKIASCTNEKELLERARRQINYVASVKTEYAAWFYTHPAGDSRIRHDNYHTGGILDGILDYMELSGDNTHRELFKQGLEYYRTHLFEEDGAPRWMNDSKYPYDTHGSAQGIITFSKVGDFATVQRILQWVQQHMQRKDGAYRYQKGRFFISSRPYTLMRWCNSWMAFALATYLASGNDNNL